MPQRGSGFQSCSIPLAPYDPRSDSYRPMMPGFYNYNYQILQTLSYVAILVEMIHDARIIQLDGRPHLNSSLRLWLGDSRGHWEGNPLVVDTTNVTEKVFARPGIGTLLLEAIGQRDYRVVQGCTLVIALSYVTVNLLVDLAYGAADPRIRVQA